MALDPESARILSIIGDNVRAERSRRNISQEELAHMSGMHTTQVARIERGEHDSGVSRHVKVAWALGIPPGTLFQDLETSGQL